VTLEEEVAKEPVKEALTPIEETKAEESPLPETTIDKPPVQELSEQAKEPSPVVVEQIDKKTTPCQASVRAKSFVAS
jgi:hypothetical protein